MKICSKCGNKLEKSLENFHKRKTSPDGFATICKKCVKFSKPRNIKHWNNNKLLCLNCKEYKDICEFNTNVEKTHRKQKDSNCKTCKTIQYNKRKENNRGKKDLNRLLLERWHGLKDRAKRTGHTIDFKWEFLLELWNKQNGLCAISSIPMTFTMNSGRVFTNVSIDRKDSNIGYLKENIQLVCMAVNQMKSDMEMSELLYFCKQILENYES